MRQTYGELLHTCGRRYEFGAGLRLLLELRERGVPLHDRYVDLFRRRSKARGVESELIPADPKQWLDYLRNASFGGASKKARAVANRVASMAKVEA